MPASNGLRKHSIPFQDASDKTSANCQLALPEWVWAVMDEPWTGLRTSKPTAKTMFHLAQSLAFFPFAREKVRCSLSSWKDSMAQRKGRRSSRQRSLSTWGLTPPVAKKRSSSQRRPGRHVCHRRLGAVPRLLSSPARPFCGYKVPVSYRRVRSMSRFVCCSVFDRKPAFHLTECDITVQVLAPKGQQPLDFSLVTIAWLSWLLPVFLSTKQAPCQVTCDLLQVTPSEKKGTPDPLSHMPWLSDTPLF